MLDGTPPTGHTVPDDYPSEFSAGVAQSAGKDGMVGPFFITTADGLVVGEIGGAFIDDSTVEIGYAVVDSQQGKGHASGAVTEIVKVAGDLDAATRIVAHTPPDRPGSGRVLEKAGFRNCGIVEDEHEGETIEAYEWELALGG